MTVKTSDKYDLRQRAILVKVNTSLFGTQKKDKDATASTADHQSEKSFVQEHRQDQRANTQLASSDDRLLER